MNYDFDAAIFDMDGTLLDTMAYWRYSSLEFLLAHQLPVKTEDLVRMADTPARAMLLQIAERDGIDIGDDESVANELHRIMQRHYLQDAKMLPGVPEYLRMVREKGIRMCVATTTPAEYALEALERQGILEYFDFVTGGHEYGVGKDDPEYFRIVAERLGTTPEKCTVYEDALYSMRNAKAAGCRVVAIDDESARLQRDDIKALADVYVKDYRDLL